MVLAAESVPDIVLWAPAVSALLLLLSALAALRTAQTTAQSFRRSVTPNLDVTFLVPRPRGPLQLTVRNLGGGHAKTPCVLLVVKDGAMFKYLGDGLFRPGEGLKITTNIDAGTLEAGDYAAMAGCRDLDNRFHAWTTHWQYRLFRDRWRRPIRKLEWDQAFRSFYPDIEPEGKASIGHHIDPLT